MPRNGSPKWASAHASGRSTVLIGACWRAKQKHTCGRLRIESIDSAAPMNVIILSNSASWGGLEVHTVALAEALVNSGHHTSIVCFGEHAANIYRDRIPSKAVLVNLGAPERRSVAGWLQALGDLKVDAAVLVKGTWETG